jgi:magnesium transporter
MKAIKKGAASPRKRRHFRGPRKPAGASPGTLVAIPDAHATTIEVIAYNSEKLLECAVTSIDAIPTYLNEWSVVWINVSGLANLELIEGLGKQLSIHPLAMEDVFSLRQRAKVDIYPGHSYAVGCEFSIENEELVSEQISFLFGPKFYLLYALLDALVDSYFPILEHFGERIDVLEQTIFTSVTQASLASIRGIKHDLLLLRRNVWPLREAFNVLLRAEETFISAETSPYLRDCYDHTVQILDLMENYREVASSLLEMHLSAQSARTGEISRLLTIVATTFIPLNFIAALYGMNFDTHISPFNMPELEFYFGYPAVLGAMLATALFMIRLFRRKGWLGKESYMLANENAPDKKA